MEAPRVGWLALAWAAGCGQGGPAAGAGAGDTGSAVGEAPTWHDDIAPMVAAHCAGCHREGGASFPMDRYDLGAAWAPAALVKLQGDGLPPYQMPPWFAMDTDECAPPAPWAGDERLTPTQIDTFAAWVAAGMPEGAARSFPERATEPFVGESLVPATDTPVAATGDDQYLCTPLDPGLSSTRWITGLQVEPGADDVVHHVVVFSDPGGAGAALADADGRYPCFGGSGVPGSVLFAWAPGADPLRLPASTGIPMPAGSGLIMQIHYHPSGTAASDRTTVDVAWSDEEPTYQADMRVFGVDSEGDTDSDELLAPPFEVPAGAAGHTETVHVPVEVPGDVDVRVWSVFSHMHLAGRDIKVSLLRDGGDDVCLAHNPVWDFDWQRTYVYDGAFTELPQVEDGDVVEVRCTYDNTLDNPVLAEALAVEGIDEPPTFGAGEDTTDEMCVGILGIAY